MRGTILQIGLAGGAVLMMSACGSKTVTAENASVAEVAAKVKQANLDESFISPGRWQTSMTITDMTMPGLPPEALSQMKSVMGKGKSYDMCVTPEEAKKPKEEMFAGKGADNCRYETFTMGGGVMNMVMHCAMGAEKRTMKMNGTYSPDRYHVSVESTGESTGSGKSPASGMSMKAVMDSKRIGECTGKEQS